MSVPQMSQEKCNMTVKSSRCYRGRAGACGAHVGAEEVERKGQQARQTLRVLRGPRGGVGGGTGLGGRRSCEFGEATAAKRLIHPSVAVLCPPVKRKSPSQSVETAQSD